MMELNKKLEHYRISEEEYELICDRLGREPQGIEWALFSSLWSEHCSYKSSKVHLKKFYSQSERVVEGFGENAGVIDLGEGERVAFKMESHNHPSFIEPYEGAATGVGGILRDIFTMGAKPVALANALCFGDPRADRMSYLVDGVVRGIGGYGNCVGVPNITGKTEFHSSYNGNILVNALAIGLFRPGERVFTSSAKGVGNYVVYVGAKTGRDGVHGASMASESFNEESESKKPTVQIGDPFFEKLLIESCLEVMKEDLVVAIQDMGAAGITSSSFEMASKGGVGLKIYLDQVPIRDKAITPEEILLSESQERMLLICEPKKFKALKKRFDHWNLDAEVIGEVIEKKTITLHWHDEILADINPDLIVENAPQYQRPFKIWKKQNRTTEPKKLLAPVTDLKKNLLQTLASKQGTSRNWIYQQYDQRVGAATVKDCSSDFGVIRLPDSGRSLGLALGCRPYVMRFDAQVGGADSVIYPSLKLAAKGFQALALTDCLNFGNPEKPELMSEFVASVESMSLSCEALDVPVISGNVSFYNETLGKNVTSTPFTGVVGLRPNCNIPTSTFQNEGEDVLLVSLKQWQINGRWAELKKQETFGQGDIDVQASAQMVKALCKVNNLDKISSSRVVGQFGLLYSLSRMSLKGVGAKINLGPYLIDPSQPEKSLLSEVYYQVLLTTQKENTKSIKTELEKVSDLQVNLIGETTAKQLTVGDIFTASTDDLSKTYYHSWENIFENLA